MGERMLINAGITSIDDVSSLFTSASSSTTTPNSTSLITSLIIHGNHINSLASATHPLILPSLKKLNLSSNDLRFIDMIDLQGCPNIEILDLAANRIIGIKGLSFLSSLHTLNLAFNNLCDLQWLTTSLTLPLPTNSSNIHHLQPTTPYQSLQKLDLRDNNIQDTSELFHLRHLINIKELRFQDIEFLSSSSSTTGLITSTGLPPIQSTSMNPVCSKPTYLPIILATCPSLQILDGIPVTKWREILSIMAIKNPSLSLHNIINTVSHQTINNTSDSVPTTESTSITSITTVSAPAPPPLTTVPSSTVDTTNQIIPDDKTSITGDVPTPLIDVAASRFLKRYLGPENAAIITSSRKSSISLSSTTTNLNESNTNNNGSLSPLKVQPLPLATIDNNIANTTTSNPNLQNVLQHEQRIENLETKLALLTAAAAITTHSNTTTENSKAINNIPVTTPTRTTNRNTKDNATSPITITNPPIVTVDTLIESETNHNNTSHLMDLTNISNDSSFTTEEKETDELISSSNQLSTLPIPEAPLTQALRKAKQNNTSDFSSSHRILASPTVIHSTTVPSPEDFGAIRQQLSQLQADHHTTMQNIQNLQKAYTDSQKSLTDTQADLQMALERGRVATMEVERLRTELALHPPIDAVERLRSKLAESQAALAAAPSREVVEALQARVNDYAAEAARLQATSDEAHRIATRAEMNANDNKQLISQLTTERDKLTQELALLQSENHTLRVTIEREKELRDRIEEAGRLSGEQLTLSATQALVRAKEAETIAQQAKQAEQNAQRSEARAVAEATAARADAEHWKARYQEAIERGKQDIEAERQRAMSAIQAAEERLVAARNAAEEEVRRVTTDANSRLTGAREALENHASKHATLSKSLNDSKTEVADLSRRLAAAQVDIVEKDRRIVSLRDDLTVMERERNIAISSAQTSMSNKISELINRIDTAEANARASKAETESLQLSLQSTRNEVRIKEVQLNDANETIKKLRKDINKIREENISSENGYKQAIDELRQQLEDITNRYEQLNQEQNDLLHRVEIAETSATASRKTVTQLEGVVRELQNDANSAEVLRRSLTEKETALSFIEREVAQVKTSFEQRLLSLTNEKETLRKDLHDNKYSLTLAQDMNETQRQEILHLHEEIKNLQITINNNEQIIKQQQVKVASVEAEMRVLLNELDTTKARNMEQTRRMTNWLSQMQVEVMGNGNNTNNNNNPNTIISPLNIHERSFTSINSTLTTNK